MKVLEEIKKRFRAQSHMPHPVRKGQPRWVPDSGVDISIAEGEYGSTNPEFHLIQKRLDCPSTLGIDKDASITGLVDLQLLDPQLKVSIKTGVRNRIKRVLKFLGD